MKVSVIIPAYNEQKYLAACLESIYKQTRQPDEVIVVDNNSTDKTAEIAKKYGARVIKEKKKGIAWARNRGFDAATGDIIVRFDADTNPHPTWIEIAEKEFKKRNIAAIGGRNYYRGATALFHAWVDFYHSAAYLFNGNMPVLSGSNFAITKKMWEKIKKMEMKNQDLLCEDIHISVLIRKHGGVIARKNSLKVKTSSRRAKRNPLSFYIEYPFKIVMSYVMS